MANNILKIGALVNYFNDIDMLQMQVESGQFDEYTQIYIVDGPYAFTEALGLLSSEPAPRLDQTDFGRALLENRKYTYVYKVWPDEAAKRIFGYELINEDLVVLHDTDEFYEDFSSELLAFNKSEYGVATFYCQNLYLDGVYISAPFYSTNKINALPHKAFAFKKSVIKAEDHLNYLWLVGVRQTTPNKALIKNTPICHGYHFTGMRSHEGQKQKLLFYTSLHETQNTNNSTLLLRSKLVKEIKNLKLSNSEAIDIYLRTNPGFCGVPGLGGDYIVNQRIIGSDYLENINGKVIAKIDNIQSGVYKLLPGSPFFFYLPGGLNIKTISFDSNVNGMIKLWSYNFGEPIMPMESIEISQKNITLTSQKKSNAHGILYQLNILNNDSSTDPIIFYLH